MAPVALSDYPQDVASPPLLMPQERTTRLDLLERWEAEQHSKTVVLATRADAPVKMGESVRYVYEHLRDLPQRPLNRLDFVLVGAGLSPEVGARTVSLLREYARELRVVVTGAVGPGETLAAMGADAVIMHPMATLTTALPQPAGGPESAGLDGIVAHLLSGPNPDQSTYDAVLRRSDAASVGAAIHRVEWVRHQLQHLAGSRLTPPEPAEVAALIDLLTRRVQRAGEPVDRRTARSSKAIPVVLPTPDMEALIFDLHVTYESALDLLSPAPLGPTAILESTGPLHTLDRVETADGRVVMQWLQHHQEAVH